MDGEHRCIEHVGFVMGGIVKDRAVDDHVDGQAVRARERTRSIIFFAFSDTNGRAMMGIF